MKIKTYYVWYLAKKKNGKYLKKPKVYRISIKKFLDRLNYWGMFGSKVFQTKKEAINYYN